MRQTPRPRRARTNVLASSLASLSLAAALAAGVAGAGTGCQARRYNDSDPSSGSPKQTDSGDKAVVVSDADSRKAVSEAATIAAKGQTGFDAMPLCEESLSKLRFEPVEGALPAPRPETLAYFSTISILAYKRKPVVEKWAAALGFSEVEEIVDKTTATEAWILDRPEFMVVTFGGTQGFWDVLTDIDLTFDKSLFDSAVHKGFLRSYRGKGTHFKGVRLPLIEAVKRRGWPRKKLYVTGHSLGGALGALFAADLSLIKRYQGGEPNSPVALPTSCSALGGPSDAVDGVVTFGITRIGNARFSECYNALLKDKTWRVVYDLDLFPLMASKDFYRHVGQRIHVSKDGVVDYTPEQSEEPGQGFARFFRTLFNGGIARNVIDHMSYGMKFGALVEPTCPATHPAAERLGLK